MTTGRDSDNRTGWNDNRQKEKKKMDIKDRFEALLATLKVGVYEKDTELGMALLAAVAGESVLLLGPPGVAKSMVARRVKEAFCEAKSFEYLMSRFSTPDEIFGPVSISRLKTDDLYERNIEGFMPSADVVFLDEIWKAGPAILNTLLTIINEKVFRNGRDEMRVPLKLLIGASNELPAEGEGLEALWDRFLVRIVSGCVKNEDNFYRILLQPIGQTADKGTMQTAEDGENALCDLAIRPEEYAQWSREIDTIGVTEEVLKGISFVRKHLTNLPLDETEEIANRTHHIYVSDRRWQHIARLLRASAFIHGRRQVELQDMLVLVNCLWSDPVEIEPIRRLVVRAVMNDYAVRIAKMQASMSIDVKRARAVEALREAKMEGYHRDDNKELFDGFNYRIDRFGTGNTYIFFVDYKNMKDYSRMDAPLEGVVYADPLNPKKMYIRTMSDNMGMISNGVPAQRVKLYRDNDHIYINGVQYPIHQHPVGNSYSALDHLMSVKPDTDYDTLIEEVAEGISQMSEQLTEHHLLLGDDDRAEVVRQTKALNHELALLRVESQKLYYV